MTKLLSDSRYAPKADGRLCLCIYSSHCHSRSIEGGGIGGLMVLGGSDVVKIVVLVEVGNCTDRQMRGRYRFSESGCGVWQITAVEYKWDFYDSSVRSLMSGRASNRIVREGLRQLLCSKSTLNIKDVNCNRQGFIGMCAQ
ncbi:hypothetical protein Tco_1359959 [Tanacetum coccineum]